MEDHINGRLDNSATFGFLAKEVDIVFKIISFLLCKYFGVRSYIVDSSCLGLCEFDNTESLLKHEVSEGEEGVDGAGLLLLLLLGAALNGVQPGGHHDVILAVEEVVRRDDVREEVPRGGELATPVTHGGAVAGDAVDVADVSLGPLAVEPEAVDIRGRGVGNWLS